MSFDVICCTNKHSDETKNYTQHSQKCLVMSYVMILLSCHIFCYVRKDAKLKLEKGARKNNNTFCKFERNIPH